MIAPGIYFNLDEDAYRAAPGLSGTETKNILISPLDCWTYSSMNPDYKDEKTPAMVTGTAFHRRLLEPARFAQIYAARPSKADYPDAIDGGDALKAECERLGLKKSGRNADLIERILEADPRAKIWPVIEQGLLADMQGLTLLPREQLAEIERMAEIVLASKDAARALTGGISEVSIFWVDEEYGVPMKARLDSLKTRAIIEVKSFANKMGKPIDIAVVNAIASEGYHIQAARYDAAVKAAKEMLRRDKSAALHGAENVDNEWLTAFASCLKHAFYFVFIETGAVTNVRVREWREHETFGGSGMSQNAYWSQGQIGYRTAVRRYAECLAKFGPDKPWIEDVPARPFRDDEFPLWMFNEVAA